MFRTYQAPKAGVLEAFPPRELVKRRRRRRKNKDGLLKKLLKHEMKKKLYEMETEGSKVDESPAVETTEPKSCATTSIESPRPQDGQSSTTNKEGKDSSKVALTPHSLTTSPSDSSANIDVSNLDSEASPTNALSRMRSVMSLLAKFAYELITMDFSRSITNLFF